MVCLIFLWIIPNAMKEWERREWMGSCDGGDVPGREPKRELAGKPSSALLKRNITLLLFPNDLINGTLNYIKSYSYLV